MMIVILFFVWEDPVCLVIIITIIIITIKFDACAATDSAWRWTDAAVCSRVTEPVSFGYSCLHHYDIG